jgi:hypothetical protein
MSLQNPCHPAKPCHPGFIPGSDNVNQSLFSESLTKMTKYKWNIIKDLEIRITDFLLIPVPHPIPHPTSPYQGEEKLHPLILP